MLRALSEAHLVRGARSVWRKLLILTSVRGVRYIRGVYAESTPDNRSDMGTTPVLRKVL